MFISKYTYIHQLVNLCHAKQREAHSYEKKADIGDYNG